MNWAKDMGTAYSQGLADGAIKCARPELGGGFDACYWQGFGHGSNECRCPIRLAGKRDGRCCIVCGNRRHA